MKALIELMKVMFRIGCIGFGGGSALIPVIEKETVVDRELVSKETYDEDVIVASITPGALPVEIASGVGYSVAANKGMVAGAVSMALPGAIFTVILLALFSNIKESALQQIQYLAVGVSVFIIYLLIHYITKVILQEKDVYKKVKIVLITVGVYLLNGGKEIYSLFGIEKTPIFDISSIQVIAMAFFVIFFLGEKRSIWKNSIAAVLCLVYLLTIGKSHLIQQTFIETTVKGLMIILAAIGFFQSVKDQKILKNIDKKKIGKSIQVWSVFLICMVVPAFLFCDQTLLYVGRGFLSSLVSFGGGDAYLSVAEGMFVSTGMISELLFYGQLVTVVNILPGSILCKTLAGAGYMIGYGLSGNIWKGIIFAIAGFGVSVFGSCVPYISCLHAYMELQNIKVIRMIGSYIRPIISGLLINICLSLVKNNLVVGNICGMPLVYMLAIMAVIYIGIVWLERKKCNYGKIVGLAAIVSFLLCNLNMIIV